MKKVVKFLRSAEHKPPQRPFFMVLLTNFGKKAILINKQPAQKSCFSLFSQLQSTFVRIGGGPESVVGENSNLQRLCVQKCQGTLKRAIPAFYNLFKIQKVIFYRFLYFYFCIYIFIYIRSHFLFKSL